MRKVMHWAALTALVVAAPLFVRDLAAQDPAALLVRLQGNVQVVHGGGAAGPAAVGERLMAGDEVRPDGGARAILMTSAGATQVVTEATTVSAPSGAGSSDMFARAMRTLAQAASADARAAGGRQGMIRPIPGEPVLVAPRNGLVVTSNRPTFSWMAVDGASGYTIQVRRVDGGRPVRFEVGSVTEWPYPISAPALLPGGTYAWTVAPTRGRPTREQQFRVVDADVFGELAQTLTEISDLGIDPSGDGLFLTAIVYRDLDLFYDAAAVLDQLEEAGDLTAELYLLKGEVLTQLGRVDEARAAFDRADEMMR